MQVSVFATTNAVAEKIPIRLQLKWKHQFQFAGYYAAVEKGFYDSLGLQVELIEPGEGDKPAEAVFHGNADFGVATSDIILYKDKGYNPVVVATIFQHSPQIIVARKKSDVYHVHNLVGKKIMVEAHAADVLTYMKDEGVSSDKYTVYPHTFTIDKLLTGEVDAMTAYITDEPFQLQQANEEYTIISPMSGGIDFYGDLLFTTQDYIEKHPDIVEKFRHATLQGWRYAMENKEEIISLIVNKYSQRHSVEHLRYEATTMNRFIMQDVVMIGYSNEGRWQNILKIYKDIGLIQNNISLNGLLYHHYSEEKFTLSRAELLTLIAFIVGFSIAAYFYFAVSRKLKIELKKQELLQKELAEREELYRLLTENMQDVVWTLDPDTLEFTYVSPTVTKLRGFTPEEIMAQPLDAALTPEGAKIVHDRILQGRDLYKENPDMYYREVLEQPCKDGSSVWTEVVTRYYHNPKTDKIEFLGVTRNITERKQAEDLLRESEEKFRTLMRVAPVGIFVLEGTKVVLANDAITAISGYSEEELLSMEHLPFIHPDDRSMVIQRTIDRQAGLAVPDRYEFKIIDRYGKEKWIDVSAAFLMFKGKRTSMGAAFDITKQKQMEEKLRELNSTKDKFFSIIAHDLKNPLGNFKMITKMLYDSHDDFTLQERMEFLELMKSSAENVYTLLENLLEWSRSQRGQLPFNPTEVLLLSLVDNCVSLLSLQAANKGVSLVNNVSPEFTCSADTNMLIVIIRNLISNSIKFTPSGGKVSVQAEHGEQYDDITVEDTGVGMPESVLSNLFRLDKNTTTLGTSQERGTGLGLILCKEFAEKHGGCITVTSTVGKGSRFTIHLPKLPAVQE